MKDRLCLTLSNGNKIFVNPDYITHFWGESDRVNISILGCPGEYEVAMRWEAFENILNIFYGTKAKK